MTRVLSSLAAIAWLGFTSPAIAAEPATLPPADGVAGALRARIDALSSGTLVATRAAAAVDGDTLRATRSLPPLWPDDPDIGAVASDQRPLANRPGDPVWLDLNDTETIVRFIVDTLQLATLQPGGNRHAVL